MGKGGCLQRGIGELSGLAKIYSFTGVVITQVHSSSFVELHIYYM